MGNGSLSFKFHSQRSVPMKFSNFTASCSFIHEALTLDFDVNTQTQPEKE